jgi:hypothetical protein
MTESDKVKQPDASESKLPPRDWVLLPTISVLTIGVIVFLTEFIARQIYTESRPFIAACMVSMDRETGGRVAPNSVCWDKKFESDRVEYKFNNCGNRDDGICGKKAPGTYRIVLVGSSVAMGSLVAHDKTVAALLPKIISQESRRSVEVYNEGMVTVHPFVLAQRMREVLAAKPDLILWILTPFDIQVEPTSHGSTVPSPDASHFAKLKLTFKDAFTDKSFLEGVRDVCLRGISKLSQYTTDTAAGTLVLHLLYHSRNQYLKSYLAGGDEADFLRVKQSRVWNDRLQQFARDAALIHANAGGVPMLTTLIPNRAQAALISAGEWPQDLDPYLLDKELREIISRQGGTYVEISSHLSQIPDAEKYFFPIDGHPNTIGHSIFSTLLARALVSGVVPALTPPASSAPIPDHET